MVSMRYISPIDPHVHLRWHENDETYMHFMEEIFNKAREMGFAGIIGQGNTKPPLTERNAILEYMERADQYRGNIAFKVHGVLTPDKEQQKRMFAFAQEPDSPVASVKIFYVETSNTDNIQIVNDEEQLESWMLGRDVKFNGNRTGHFEDGKLFVGKYDPTNPASHSTVQPAEAELRKVQQQYRNAYDTGFAGNFIVFHTSNPATPKWIRKENAKMHPRFRTLLEASPHHGLLNVEQDYPLHGAEVKVNPPLRPQKMQEELCEEIARGNIHMIGSDEAPHTYTRKQGDKPASGIRSMEAIPLLILRLREIGIKEGRLEKLLFHTANNVYFGGKLKPREVTYNYRPEQSTGYNAFSRVEKELVA